MPQLDVSFFFSYISSFLLAFYCVLLNTFSSWVYYFLFLMLICLVFNLTRFVRKAVGGVNDSFDLKRLFHAV